MSRKSVSAKGTRASRTLLFTLILVTGFSLATWVFFYFQSMKLTSVDTPVIVGFWFMVVFLGRIVVENARKRRKASK